MNWLIDALKQIAKGMPVREAANLASDLLAKLDSKYDPIMDAPPMTPHAIDLPHPWQPYPVSSTGQRGYKHPDGRYACGIHVDRYREVLGTKSAEVVARLVHAHAHLYIEASSEDDLVAKVSAFDKAWGNAVVKDLGDDGVHCTAHVDYNPASRVVPAVKPKRITRTRNARTTQDP